MSTYLEEMARQRGELIERYQARIDALADEGRAATSDEAVELDAWEADIARLGDEVSRARRMDALRAMADEVRGEVAPRIERAREERRDPTDHELLLALYSGEVRTARFGAPPDDPRDLDSRVRDIERRALQSQGGSAVETSFYDQLMVYERTWVPMLAIGRLVDQPTGAPMVFPRLTADVNTAGTVTAEAAGITEADATISSVTLNAFGYKAISLWSWELDQDNVIGLEEAIGDSLARQLAITAIGAHLTTGTGTTQPWGIVTRSGNGGTAGGTATGSPTDTFFSPSDLIDLKFTLAKGYRDAGSWVVSTTAFAKMRKFKDSNKQFLFQASLTAGAPDSFDGRPIYENPAMAAVASASKSVVFGDMNRYVIKRVTPVRLQPSDDYKYSTDQRALKLVERIDADLVDTAGSNYLVSANT